jgi:hydroxymethylbilane synthase
MAHAGKRHTKSSENPPLLRLGTRGSALAMAQSKLMARKLTSAHRAMKLHVEIVEISTTGDRDRKTALKTFGGTGVFAKELERALIEKEIDLAVHSLKDLPTAQPKGLVLAAVSKREDVRDVAIVAGGRRLAELPGGAVVGCGSPRRRAQLARRFPNLRFEEIRGNVDTRLRKVAEGHCAATILARAGLKRLGRPEKDGEVLPLSLMLPAPGQGALGLECRARDSRTRTLLLALHDPLAAACVEAERSCLAALGGGCHLPLGAHGSHSRKTGMLTLRAVLAAPDGSLEVNAEASGPPTSAKRLGTTVAALLKETADGRAVLDAQNALPGSA